MAKIYPSALIDSLSGSLSGSTFKRVKSGTILRRRLPPTRPQSAGQQATRKAFNDLAGDWHGLSDVQKEMWNKLATQMKGPQTGFNVFLELNTRLLKAGHASLVQIDTPPLTPSTPPYIEGFDTAPDTTAVVVSWTSPQDAQNYVQVFFAVEAGYSFKNKEKWCLVETVRSDVGSITHVHGYPAGTSLLYRARTIDTSGRISPWTSTDVGATIGARYDEDEYDDGYYS